MCVCVCVHASLRVCVFIGFKSSTGCTPPYCREPMNSRSISLYSLPSSLSLSVCLPLYLSSFPSFSHSISHPCFSFRFTTVYLNLNSLLTETHTHTHTRTNTHTSSQQHVHQTYSSWAVNVPQVLSSEQSPLPWNMDKIGRAHV